jgi:hypothetical protein
MMRAVLGKGPVVGISRVSGNWQMGWRRVVALLALVGVLVHAGLPLLHAPRAAAAPLDTSVLICTGFGVKVVQLADLHAPDDQSEAPQQARIYYCPLCLAQQMAVAAILPDGVSIAAPAFAGAAPAPPPPALFVAQAHYASAHARAPPSIA